jgi:hypothetical protein
MSITRGLHVHNSRLAASTLPIPLPVIAAECDHPSQANEAGTSALVPMQPHFQRIIHHIPPSYSG